MLRIAMTAVMTAMLAAAGVAEADVWDVQTINDNTPSSTQNELIHGSDQIHDLGVLPGPLVDQDWYRMSQRPYSSYEAVVDATSGDFGTLLLVRTDAMGQTLQLSGAVGVGYSRSLRFSNDTTSAIDTQRLIVASQTCVTCGADDVYRIRFYETTYAIPRFNNSGTQVTVLILQNPATYTIGGKVYFWAANGALLNASDFSLAAKNTLVLPTQTIVPGASGSITITNDGRYGDLAGKAVALEPATGFSFDTPMVPRPH